MFSVFFLTLREGIEAALIVGIILAYLHRSDRQHLNKMVWGGLSTALALSVLGGWIVFSFLGGYNEDTDKNALKIFEGVSCLLAAVVLTWVIVWMHRNARHIGAELRAAVDSAGDSNNAWAIFGLVFLTVGREGLETILILPGMRSGVSNSDMIIAIVAGLSVSLVIGVALHRGSKVIDIQKFFKYTGVLLIFVASGLVAYGIHELQSADKFPVVVKEIWNTNHILHDKQSRLGEFLKGLFGYNGNPSLLEVIGYFTYLFGSLYLFLKPAAEDKKEAA